MLTLSRIPSFSISRLGSELIPQKQLKEEAETVMEQLMTLVKYTAVSILPCDCKKKAVLKFQPSINCLTMMVLKFRSLYSYQGFSIFISFKECSPMSNGKGKT